MAETSAKNQRGGLGGKDWLGCHDILTFHANASQSLPRTQLDRFTDHNSGQCIAECRQYQGKGQYFLAYDTTIHLWRCMVESCDLLMGIRYNPRIFLMAQLSESPTAAEIIF